MTRGELQSAQQGRALVPVVGRVEAERQVLTPVQGAWGDERLAPRVEELLVPDPRGRVSADKIGYISIISCNINILHRMLCE